MKTRLTLLLLLIAVFPGCAGLRLTPADVSFENPYERLGAVTVEPNAEESQGVTLRLKPVFSAPLNWREENVIFAHVRENRGGMLKLVMNRTDSFRPGSRPDSSIQTSRTLFEGEAGELQEDLEVTERGEILRFLAGAHKSRAGNFKITSWTRSAVVPESPVKRSDPWGYQEEIGIKIDSQWVREIDPQPRRIQAASTLEGFALVKGVRCAVVKTKATQIKREHFKVFFKEIFLDTFTEIEETSFWDYKAGRILGRITRTVSNAAGINVPLAEHGESQSIAYLVLK